MAYGITVKHDTGGSRMEIRSKNQAGLLYAVPSEGSWVASPETLHAHALAGFLHDLSRLQDPRVTALMRKWGLYYRDLPLEEDDHATGDTTKGA
ncbi:MAG: hypothetical protein FJ318_07400 [SAR202 cluster bacterium]|nr:hypothetical protein [SAR202 cluster bacterium]